MARSHIQRAKKRPFQSLRMSRGAREEAVCREERKVWREARAEVRIFRSAKGVSWVLRRKRGELCAAG
jgi:hypothetical protein